MTTTQNDRRGLHQVLGENSGSRYFLVANDQSEIEVRSPPQAAVRSCEPKSARKGIERCRIHVGRTVGPKQVLTEAFSLIS